MTNSSAKTRLLVLVPVYNAAEWIEPCIERLMAYRGSDAPTYDVCAWNDASTDPRIAPLLERLAQRHPDLQVTANRENLGYLSTCNAAFERFRSRYPFIFLCNSDVLVTDGAIESGLRVFESQPSCALVSYLATQNAQCTVSMPDGVDFEDMHAWLRERRPLSGSVPALPSVGCLLGVRVAAIEGPLFDTIFRRGYGEETDLHFRLLARGWTAEVVPDAFLYHRGEASFGRMQQPKENFDIFFARWGPQWRAAVEQSQRDLPLGPLKNFDSDELHLEARTELTAFARTRAAAKRARGDGTRGVVACYLSFLSLERDFDRSCRFLLELRDRYDDVYVLMNESLLGRLLPAKRLWFENVDVVSTLRSLGQPVNLLMDPFHPHTLPHDRVDELTRALPVAQAPGEIMSRLRESQRTGRQIAVVSPDYQIGGGIYVIVDFVRALRRGGYHVTVITPAGRGHQANDNFGADRVAALGDFNLFSTHIFDVIVVTWWESLYWCAHIRAREIVWLAQSIEDLFVREELRADRLRIMGAYLLRGVRIIAISEWIQATLEVRYGAASDLILNELDASIPWAAHQRPRAWPSLLKPADISVIVEGNTQPYKNLQEAVALVDRLGFRRKTVVYSGEDLDYMRALTATGWRVLRNLTRCQVLEELAAHDVLLRTSLLDSYGLSPLEMMATGGLVMVRHYQGAPSVCRHESTALCFTTEAEILAMFRRNEGEKGAFFAGVCAGGLDLANARIGSAEAPYVRYVDELFDRPAESARAPAVQLMCNWRNHGAEARPLYPSLYAQNPGHMAETAWQALVNQSEIKTARPLRHRLVDQLWLKVFKRALPTELVKKLKATLQGI